MNLSPAQPVTAGTSPVPLPRTGFLRHAPTVLGPVASLKAKRPLSASAGGVEQAVGCILSESSTLLPGATVVPSAHVSTRVVLSKVGVVASLGEEVEARTLTPAGMLMVKVPLSSGEAMPYLACAAAVVPDAAWRLAALTGCLALVSRAL